MASRAVKVALIVLLSIVICVIVFVPIAINVTSEENEELKSTVPETEKLIQKTSKTDTTKASSTPIEVTTTTEPVTTTSTTVTTENSESQTTPTLPSILPPAPPPAPNDSQCQPEAPCSTNQEGSGCNVEFIGDGYCDGVCNKHNPDNDPTTTDDDYDGGDCCSPNQSFYFCDFDCCECFCHQEGIQYEEPAFGTPSSFDPIGPTVLDTSGPTCESSYMGDGFCDALCNNEENGFDDGDCCLDVIMDQYCNGVEGGCTCHGISTTTSTTPPAPTDSLCEPRAYCINFPPGACNLPFIGDGHCDAGCNVLNPDDDPTTLDDDYDGGDCCSPTNHFNFCDAWCCECFCYQEGIQYEELAGNITLFTPLSGLND